MQSRVVRLGLVEVLERMSASKADAEKRPLRGEPQSVGLIRNATLMAVYEHGYHGTSVREIAARAGISVAGLYHHFSSKREILFELMSHTIDDLIESVENARAGAGDDPERQLAAAVQAHVRFHTDRREEAFVGNTELRSLDPEQRSAIVAKRDCYEQIIRETVVAGRADGTFSVDDPAQVTRAIITMCTAVASWYRPGGRAAAQEIADQYSRLAVQMVGCETALRSDSPDGKSASGQTIGPPKEQALGV